MITDDSVIHLILAILVGAVVAYFVFARPARKKLTHAEKALKAREDQLHESQLEAAKAQTELDSERKSHSDRIDELDNKFKGIASEVLNTNSENILKLMSERFAGEQEKAGSQLMENQKNFEILVQPLKDDLKRFQKQVDDLEKNRLSAYEQVTQQIKNLTQSEAELKTETSRLVQALRRPSTRGRWGEYQLRNVLEMTGMLEHVDFIEQETLDGEDSRSRPDVIVHMPGNKSVVIDAKTPLDAYLNLHEAQDDEKQKQFAADHARQVRSHVNSLASKRYWDSLPVSPDFVVMFIPGEALYSVAFEQDPELFEYAISKKVLLCTPTTLIALVKAIAYGWQQEQITESAQLVANLGKELHQRVDKFVDHMDGLGKSLQRAVDRYNKSVGSLESRVLPTARRFEELGVTPPAGCIPTLNAVDLQTRTVSARSTEAPGETKPEQNQRVLTQAHEESKRRVGKI